MSFKREVLFSPLLRGLFLVALLCICVGAADADEGQAKNLLKAMSDYMAAEMAISFDYDTDLQVVTTDLQKLTFASSGTVSLARPDRLRVTRSGGFADVEMVFDGKALTILDKDNNRYAQLDALGTIDQLVDNLRVNFGVEAPGADLLLSTVYDQLIDTVVDVKDLGSGVVDGVEANHLAFRTASVDWEIWIAIGTKPYPVRYMVTSKLVAQAPAYSVTVRDWKTGADVAADDFAFKAPAGAAKANPGELRDIDELPDFASKGNTP